MTSSVRTVGAPAPEAFPVFPTSQTSRTSPTEAVEATIAEEGGPLLVHGPMEVTLPDGHTESSARPVSALCLCRRSKNYPWCDTSHRKHEKTEPEKTEIHREHG